MGEDDDRKRVGRKTPPTDDEWAEIWQAVLHSQLMWHYFGRAWVEIRTNWKALLAILAGIAILNSPQLSEIAGMVLKAIGGK